MMNLTEWVKRFTIVGIIFTVVLWLAIVITKLLSANSPKMAPALLLIGGGALLLWAVKIRPGKEDVIPALANVAIVTGILQVLGAWGFAWVGVIVDNFPASLAMVLGLWFVTEFLYTEYS